AAHDPLVGPEELVRSLLVGDPVAIGIPERPALEHHHAPAAACEALREGAAAGAAAHDEHVHLVVVAVARHAVHVRDPALVRVEDEGRVVLGRADRALEEAARSLHSTPRSCTSTTGSTANAGSGSQCSVPPGPSAA